jgi:hypothetical protein
MNRLDNLLTQQLFGHAVGLGQAILKRRLFILCIAHVLRLRDDFSRRFRQSDNVGHNEYSLRLLCDKSINRFANFTAISFRAECEILIA